MKKLIIAEKPSLGIEIASAIGNMQKHDGYLSNDEYIVSFAFGHLFELYSIDDYLGRGKTSWKMDELPFIPSQFIYKLKDDSGIKKQYNTLKKLILSKEVTSIINCGDADREGEVIINNIIYNIFKEESIEKPIERLWLKSINADEIRESLQKLKPIIETKPLFDEGLARTYLDWIYGINFTRYVTLKANEFYPVGRVLTPIVQKVYDRKKEMDHFIPTLYYEIDSLIKKDGQEIKATVKNSKFAKEEKLSVEGIANNLNHTQSIVSSKTIKEVKKQPPKLFSLTTLQNVMVKKHKVSLDKTLEAAQSLYTKGYISYPRTNTEYLHASEKEDVQKLVEQYAKVYDIEFKDNKRIFDSSKVESHSALLPTSKEPNPSSLSDIDQIVYNTILNRFLANFCTEETIVEETIVVIKAMNHVIELKGNAIKQEGWYKYESPDTKEKFLPLFDLDEIVDVKYTAAEKKTSAPKPLTLVELNNFLKNPFKNNKSGTLSAEDPEESEDSLEDTEDYSQMLKGIEIGTVATRDSIIKNAIAYEYITENKTTLDITPKGEFLIESLKALNIDMSKEKTVETSITLKEVFKGEKTVQNALDEMSQYLDTIIDPSITIRARVAPGIKNSDTRPVITTCPFCKSPIYENAKAYSCSGYKAGCKFVLWKNNKFLEKFQIKITPAVAKKLIEDKKIFKKDLISKNGKKYNAYFVITLSPTGNHDFSMEFANKKQ